MLIYKSTSALLVYVSTTSTRQHYVIIHFCYSLFSIVSIVFTVINIILTATQKLQPEELIDYAERIQMKHFSHVQCISFLANVIQTKDTSSHYPKRSTILIVDLLNFSIS